MPRPRRSPAPHMQSKGRARVRDLKIWIFCTGDGIIFFISGGKHRRFPEVIRSMNEKQNFTTGNLPLKMLSFMFPILGALILQAMYSAVDLLIVGHFGTTAGLSAVSTGSNIMGLFTFPMASLTTGVTVLIGQYIGEKRTEKIGELIGGAVFFLIILSLAISALIFAFAPQIAVIMQAPEEALGLTVQYIRICAVGYIFIVFYNFISAVMRGMGDSKTPLLLVVIACVVNIFGDLLLVAVFKLNVVGAAIATIAAQALAVVLSLIVIRKRGLSFDFSAKMIRRTPLIGAFVKIGLPLCMQDLLTSGTFLAICAFINALGLTSSSGYGVAHKIQSFILLIPAAFMQTLASVAAQNVGAGMEKRAREALRWSMAIGTALGIVIALLIYFCGDWISGLFTPDAEVVEKSFQYLRGFSIEAVVTCILFSFMGYFNAHSLSLFVMIQGLVQSILIRLPMSYFMATYHGETLTGIGLAAPTATVLGIVFCICYYVWCRKKGKIRIEA